MVLTHHIKKIKIILPFHFHCPFPNCIDPLGFHLETNLDHWEAYRHEKSKESLHFTSVILFVIVLTHRKSFENKFGPLGGIWHSYVYMHK
jgi:hypothetical protein